MIEFWRRGEEFYPADESPCLLITRKRVELHVGSYSLFLVQRHWSEHVRDARFRKRDPFWCAAASFSNDIRLEKGRYPHGRIGVGILWIFLYLSVKPYPFPEKDW